jgi:hypothetical protein
VLECHATLMARGDGEVREHDLPLCLGTPSLTQPSDIGKLGDSPECRNIGGVFQTPAG